MRITLLTFSALLVISGIVNVHLWSELRDAQRSEHNQVPEVGQVTSAGTAHTGDPEVPGNSPDPHQIHRVTESTSTNAKEDVLDPNDSDPKRAARARIKLLEDEEYRKTRLSQLRAAQLQQYPWISAELEFSEPEAEALLAFLAEHQLSTNLALNRLVADGVDGLAFQEASMRIQQEAQSKLENELRARLGVDGYETWKNYQTSAPERQAVARQVSETLAGTGAAANSDNVRRLAAAIVREERASGKKMQETLKGLTATDPATRERLQYEWIDERELGYRRVLDDARSYLSPTQLEAMRKRLDQEIQDARRSIREARRIAERN